MSSIGARIVEKKNATPMDAAAGIPKVLKEGESNMYEIWPNQNAPALDKGLRSLNTGDINFNSLNPRQQKLH